MCYGGLDDEEAKKDLAPKGEFFCRLREHWLKDINGDNVFHKQEIQN